MQYWWVNQNQTYKQEVAGGFLWSPKRKRNGGRNQFYDNMVSVQPGDRIFSFSDTLIKAVGIAQGPAESASKPTFGPAGEAWNDDGWYVPVEFELADKVVRPKDIIDELRPHLPSKYAPLQQNGDGNQGVYLAEVSQDFAEVLLAKLRLPIANAEAEPPAVEAIAAEEEKLEAALRGRTDIGPTQIEQLVRSRRGQGVFKANVRLNEKGCRLTSVCDHGFLVASHIKPWRACNDLEKLDGCNGLLLSPHIDRLFDRGLISFEDDGTILISSKLPSAIWVAWGMDGITNAGQFDSKQAAYLAYHRAEIFKP